jgi:hypothetical protein
MSTFTAIKKKGEVVRNETLPFNPIIDGWEYKGACCCEINFTKGDVKIKANSELKTLKVLRVMPKSGKLKLDSVFRLPSNQLEFSIKQNAISIS